MNRNPFIIHQPNTDVPGPVGLPLDDASDATDKRFADDELFIRKAFETTPAKGYELLFKRYYRPLCSHAVRFVSSKEVAEDIVVEIFSAFWEQERYRHINASYRAYLFTSVRHRAFGYLRAEFGKESLSDSLPASEPVSVAPTPVQIIQYDELYCRIELVIQSLPPQSRKVFLLSRFEGYPNRAIAEELNLSVKTVEGHLTKVLALMRKALRDDRLLAVLAYLIFWC